MCFISPFGLRPINICIYMELIFQTLPLASFQMSALSCCHDDVIWSHSLCTCTFCCVTALPCSGHKKVPAASQTIPLCFRRIDRQQNPQPIERFYADEMLWRKRINRLIVNSGGREEKVKSTQRLIAIWCLPWKTTSLLWDASVCMTVIE